MVKVIELDKFGVFFSIMMVSRSNPCTTYYRVFKIKLRSMVIISTSSKLQEKKFMNEPSRWLVQDTCT